jgi:MarR family transcriptional regulator, organic hydroperoxide resistance regulator
MPAKQAVRSKGSSRITGQPGKIDHSKVEQSTGYLIRQTFRSFTRSLEHRLAPHDVSLSMWFFLRLLWEQDGLTQKELSDELGLTQPTTVAAMDVMEARGLIQRRRSSEDRRKTNIILTKAGRALEERLLPFACEVNEAALANVTTAELQQLWTVLERINCSLDADHGRFVASLSTERPPSKGARRRD